MFTRSISAVTPSEKSSIITNRKSTKSFPTSVRWTAYVTPKPPKGAQKRKVTVFHIKVDLSSKRPMLLVFWHRQHLVQSILSFGQNWPTLQCGLSAIAELLVKIIPVYSVYIAGWFIMLQHCIVLGYFLHQNIWFCHSAHKYGRRTHSALCKRVSSCSSWLVY